MLEMQTQTPTANPAVSLAMMKFMELKPERQALLMKLFGSLGDPNAKSTVAAGALKNLLDNPAFVEWAFRIVKDLADRPLDRFVNSLIKGEFIEGHKRRLAYRAQHGFDGLITLVVNPTMRCNIACTGCYASRFQKSEDMDYGMLRRLLTECREMGTNFITISGGEPLLYPHLFEMAKEFEDMAFLMYTNSTLIDDAMAQRLASVGNIFPAISVEGFEAETDGRRGKGVFASVLSAMARLRKAGVFFGYSATPTSKNSELLADDRFVEFFLEQGVYFGWMFQYLPIGLDPDVSLMATPQQRESLRIATKRWQVTKPILVGDFWNDGPCTGGCLSATRYAYVTPHGDVTPCTFVHFTTHNYKNHTLTEIMKSDFFKAIRGVQPYQPNLLRPCKIIDRPQVLRDIVDQVGAKPTYKGADNVIRNPEVMAHLDRYAEEWGKLADAAWATDTYQAARTAPGKGTATRPRRPILRPRSRPTGRW
jgi:MoaA/NifB/PqqE/SkfB family radical SAM enzyme